MPAEKNRLLSSGIAFLIFVLQPVSAIGQDFRTVGYLPTYRFNVVDNIELNRLTHLNIAFANPDVDGNLATGEVDIDPVVQQAHAAGLEVFIALAGAGAQLSEWEGWINSSNRSSFIHKMVDYALRHDLQGIDVDLEWETVNDDYSGFVLELKDSLDLYDLKMTAAFPGTYRYPQITEEALAAFDWINLMAYDLTGPWTPDNPGPHSPYSYAENSISYWTGQGLDKDQMTLGVPFYGYDFTDQNNITAVTYAEMVAMDTAYAQLDQVGQIYYNGLPTIAQKTVLALNETGGVMIWELGQDFFGEFSLLKRIDETIEEFFENTTSETDQIIEITLYPNPVSDFVQLKMNTPHMIKIILFSVCQKVLKEQHYNNQELITIEMGDIPAGIYFLRVEGKEFIETYKLVRL